MDEEHICSLKTRQNWTDYIQGCTYNFPAEVFSRRYKFTIVGRVSLGNTAVLGLLVLRGHSIVHNTFESLNIIILIYNKSNSLNTIPVNISK